MCPDLPHVGSQNSRSLGGALRAKVKPKGAPLDLVSLVAVCGFILTGCSGLGF